MTAGEFRNTHGDPATWTPADHESYEHLAAIDAATTPLAHMHLLPGATPRTGKNTPPPSRPPPPDPKQPRSSSPEPEGHRLL
ncbi:hypothetical protein ACFWV1_32980 [Streptomyces sp. NPDC058700]|uniref:hypothetical protein n=1 Tax=unclassified Streptomyces TaxID=2593676 RepID=UPI0036584D0D